MSRTTKQLQTLTQDVLMTPPLQLDGLLESLGDDKMTITQELEGIARAAAQRCAYFDARARGGSHETGVKAFNKAGRIVHTKVLGYNEYRDLRF